MLLHAFTEYLLKSVIGLKWYGFIEIKQINSCFKYSDLESLINYSVGSKSKYFGSKPFVCVDEARDFDVLSAFCKMCHYEKNMEVIMFFRLTMNPFF